MPPQLAPGVVLADRYRLVDRLGAGGTGAVWRAHDEILDRGVAVKLLHEELRLDDAVRERFRREGMAAAAIHHPHAAVVYDIGEDAGRPYLVMELVDGPALSQLMDGTPIDAGVVAAVGHQVAGALGAAHERGLAHRDVKPANILLTLDGAAKVVDFGIAKILGEVTQQLTSVGVVLGTAAYLAPEQLEPDATVDGRADVYALGLLLHELLTGRPAFAGATAAEIAAQRLVADVPPPRSTGAAIPPAIDAIVERATRRDPAERFADAGDLATALAPHVPERPLQVVAEFAHRTPRTPAETQVIATSPAPPASPPEATQVLPTGREELDATQVVPVVGRATDEAEDGAEDGAEDDDATDDLGRERTTVAAPVRHGPPPAAPPPAREEQRPEGTPLAPGVVRRGLWAGLAVVGLALLAAAVLSEPAGPGGTGDGGGGDGTTQAGPHPIAGARDFDPHGGDGEHPEEVPLAFDGDPSTAWRTQRYSNEAFGNLKPGVGLLFDLGEPVEVARVGLLLATPGADLRIHASDEPFAGTDLGEPVATVDDAPREAAVDVGGTRARYWLVWLTSVPGGRAELAEVAFDRA